MTKLEELEKAKQAANDSLSDAYDYYWACRDAYTDALQKSLEEKSND
jgi:ABC-type transporter lipoprotein component MlaA